MKDSLIEEIRNPILRGMYPDPSICKGKEKYYLVNSTFSYMPGIPVFESEDLITWKQIGNVLTDPRQADLEGQETSGGIYAATIRYWNEKYYVVTTNVKDGKNFYVTADNPSGPWSLPIRLEEAAGIDPSLYFEENSCYYIGQRIKEKKAYDGDAEIYIRELDVEAGRFIGDEHIVWDGAVKEAVWSEGPHLYKKDGFYYILIAEGGTAHEHSVCIARSKNIVGPYENCKNNPVFTHRHLGKKYPIQNIGHADLIEGPDGAWFAVMLGTRPYKEKTELGRETFFVPVIWEDGWPVFYPGKGKIPAGRELLVGDGRNICIHWNQVLDMRCLMLRRPLETTEYSMENGTLQLHCGKIRAGEIGTPSYIGIRLEEHQFNLSVLMDFEPEEKEEAGVLLYYDDRNYLLFVAGKKAGKRVASIRICEKSVEREVTAIEAGPKNTFYVTGDNRKISCYLNEGLVAKDINIDALTTEEAGGFVGCTIGVYATAMGKESTNFASFHTLHMEYPSNIM